jgi:hypothetical protein
MSLMALFSSGNTGNTEKNTFKVKNENNIGVVTCYTPNGNPIKVQSTSAEHAAWLQKMNPNPKPQDTTP